MRKYLLIVMLALSICLTACGNHYEIPEEDVSNNTEIQSDNDLFEDGETELLGFVGHNVKNPSLSDDGKIMPFKYSGGELEIEYTLQSEGKGDTVGLLLFVDGKPQEYRIDESKEREYCHYFNINDNNNEQSFSFFFIPVDGKEGETVSLSIVSIYNPSFKPDMVNTSSYGWYHRILDNRYSIQMQVDAPKEEKERTDNPIFATMTNGSIKLTDEFLTKNLSEMGWDGLTIESLNDQNFYEITYEDKKVYDNIKVENNGTFNISYKLCGAPGVHYVTTFYLDNEPVVLGDTTKVETILTKGDIWTLDVSLDLSKLRDFTTFYAVSVPTNPDEYPNVNAMVIKTNSILLYKE